MHERLKRDARAIPNFTGGCVLVSAVGSEHGFWINALFILLAALSFWIATMQVADAAVQNAKG